VATVVQAPAHSVRPALQAQAPRVQVAPCPQTRPQVPQFCSSLARFAQKRPSSVAQADSGAWHSGIGGAVSRAASGDIPGGAASTGGV
jgi:hypothetical protein